MAHAVLALADSMLTVSGCVWYVPALADLRAGADRPVSRRTAAAACVTGWGTAALLIVLLLVADAWWVHGASAAAGAVAALALRLCAAVQHRRELRETERQWARLGAAAAPAGPTAPRHTVALLVGTGLTAATLIALARLAAGPESTGDWVTTAAAPAGVLAVFLTLAAAHTRATRARAERGHRGRGSTA